MIESPARKNEVRRIAGDETRTQSLPNPRMAVDRDLKPRILLLKLFGHLLEEVDAVVSFEGLDLQVTLKLLRVFFRDGVAGSSGFIGIAATAESERKHNERSPFGELHGSDLVEGYYLG